MSDERCGACIHRWEMGDAPGAIDPSIDPWKDPHHDIIRAERERADRAESIVRQQGFIGAQLRAERDAELRKVKRLVAALQECIDVLTIRGADGMNRKVAVAEAKAALKGAGP